MLEEFGIHPAYINVVLMADNFLPAFDMEEQKRMDKNVDAQIARISEDIGNRVRFISPVTEADRAAHQEFLARSARMPKEAFGNIYRITDECIGCGICTKASADEKVLAEIGKVDPLKLNALIFDQFQEGYYVAGEKVGQAWNAGKESMKAFIYRI